MKQKTTKIIIFIAISLICSISLGYASLKQSLYIKGSLFVVADNIIKITNVTTEHQPNCAYDLYLPKFENNSLTINASLPNLTCQLEYVITIANHHSLAMQLVDIQNEINNNDNIIYELNGINIGSTFLPSTTTIFTLTFKYKDNINTMPDNHTIGTILNFVWQIADNEPPHIAIKEKDNYTIFSGTDFSLASLVHVTDNLDNNIKDNLIITSFPNTFSNTNGGLYTIKYNAIDNAGNNAEEVVITVYIIEFVKIAAGRYHTLALTKDGYLYAWGHNNFGQLGDGTTTNSAKPIKINTLSNIKDIAAGYDSSYIVTNDGEVYSWGYGVYGQLGHGNATNQYTPKLISEFEGDCIEQIDAGYHSVIALNKDGQVYTWGYNGYRQLGLGTTSVTNKYSPYKITTLSNIKYISIGYWHTLAANDEEVYAWGSNAEGQLGIPSLSITGIPTKIDFNHNIKNISAGGRHSFILTNKGDIYCFGFNYYGQLGTGNYTIVRTPQYLLSDINEVKAGYEHSVAVTNKGDIYTWGFNNYAQLGIGNTTYQNTPILNTKLNNIKNTAIAYNTIFYLNSTGGIIYGSGYNYYGQLGNTTTFNSDSTLFKSYPSQVIFED